MGVLSTVRRKAALATFAGSTASTLVASVQAIVLMPLYLAQIGPSLYGAWLASGELLALLLAFDAGIPNLMIQRVGAAVAARDPKSAGAYFGTGLCVLLCLALGVGALLFAIAGAVPGWVGIQSSEAAILAGSFRIGVAAFCLMLLTFAFQGLARGLQQTAFVHASGLVGTIIGFAVTAVMLMAGHGLWSIATGLIVRSSLSLAGCAIFLFREVPAETRRAICIDREAMRDYQRLSPPLFASGIGFLVANNCQVLIVALILGPASAAVYGITRKAAELVTALLNAVGNATYGGFANLFAEGDAKRSRAVYNEIVALYVSLGLAFLGAYLAVNSSLVGVWARPELFGGVGLTTLLAVSTLTSGWCYLEVCLFRATGRHQAASVSLIVYSLARVTCAALLASLVGLHGLPSATILTSVAFGLWVRERMRREISPAPRPSFSFAGARTWGIRIAVLVGAAAICGANAPATWSFVLAAGAAMSLGSLALFLAADPMLSRYRAAIRRRRWALGGGA